MQQASHMFMNHFDRFNLSAENITAGAFSQEYPRDCRDRSHTCTGLYRPCAASLQSNKAAGACYSVTPGKDECRSWSQYPFGSSVLVRSHAKCQLRYSLVVVVLEQYAIAALSDV